MRKLNANLIFGAAIYIFGALAAQAQQPVVAPHGTVAAKVQRVVDGDTIHVRLSDEAQISGLGRGADVKVRIVGIDAPESCQPWGRESTKALRQMLPLGHVVQLRPVGVDKYGRLLSDVYATVPQNDSVFNVAAAMVATGNAWNWVERFGNGRYASEESRARASSSGLWQDVATAQRPSDFRKMHGPCQK